VRDFVKLEFSNKYKSTITVLLAAVILFLAVSMGLRAGQQAAEANTVVQTAKNLVAGFQYFYSDQNRYPSAVEFADSSIMDNYFSNFPPADFTSANCNDNFVYKKISDSNFQLDFCLVTAVSGYQSGWNVINKQQ
jgi:hypothetical protein